MKTANCKSSYRNEKTLKMKLERGGLGIDWDEVGKKYLISLQFICKFFRLGFLPLLDCIWFAFKKYMQYIAYKNKNIN